VAALLHEQCLNATSNDPNDTPGFNVAFIVSLNDHTAWVGNIDDIIALTISESSRPLVDLTRDSNEAGPNGTAEEEPIDDRCDPYEHFSAHFYRIERRDRH
jgi:hypothetical protein